MDSTTVPRFVRNLVAIVSLRPSIRIAVASVRDGESGRVRSEGRRFYDRQRSIDLERKPLKLYDSVSGSPRGKAFWPSPRISDRTANESGRQTKQCRRLTLPPPHNRSAWQTTTANAKATRAVRGPQSLPRRSRRPSGRTSI